MKASKSEKSIEEILNIIIKLEQNDSTKFYSNLKPILKKKSNDEEFKKLIDLIHMKLGETRFGLYLKIVPDYTIRQMHKKNRELLLNRLYTVIKTDVREILDKQDSNLVLSLDLIWEKKENIIEWLTDNDIQFIYRASLCYIYTALKMDRRQLSHLEHIILNIIERDPCISFEKSTGKLLPEILTSKNIRGQVEKYAYFHYKDHERATELEKKVTELQEQMEALTLKNCEQKSDIENKRVLLEQKIKVIEQNEVEIAQLNADLTGEKNRLEYEVHKYKEENRTFQISYAEKLKHRISIEIDGIKTTLKYVSDPEKGKIERRISNIETIIQNKGD